MADDNKVVTKKTTAKAASTGAAPGKPSAAKAKADPVLTAALAPASVPKKTAAKKAPTPAAPAKAAPAAPAAEPASPPVAAAPTPKPASQRKGATTQPSSVEDRPVTLKPSSDVTPEERWRMVADAAYYRAERRNFAPGYEQEDWLAAEAEVDGLLRQRLP